jgi:hypothetical protein
MKWSRPRCAKNPFARLREFAAFWTHVAPTSTCCQFAKDEDLKYDAAAFDCETCKVADALHEFTSDVPNRTAWRIYCRVATRFNADTHTAGLLLARLTEDMTTAELTDCMERLAVIYDECNPPPEHK